MTTLTPRANSFTGEPNASKPVSSFPTKTMRHFKHPQPPPPPNVTLSYPQKIDWRRLNNVWYGSFTGSETLEIYIYSSLTVLRQSIDEVCELKHSRIYMFAYLFVCLSVSQSVCLSIKKVHCPWPVTTLVHPDNSGAERFCPVFQGL